MFAIIEMNVGIIAASLPALKTMPFFHWLLKTARAMTNSSGSQPRRPFNDSSGYLKHTDHSGSHAGCYVLESLPDRAGPHGNTKDFYKADVTSGSASIDEEADYNRSWESAFAKTSDDSILPRHGQKPRPGMGIMRTTEVRISNSNRETENSKI